MRRGVVSSEIGSSVRNCSPSHPWAQVREFTSATPSHGPPYQEREVPGGPFISLYNGGAALEGGGLTPGRKEGDDCRAGVLLQRGQGAGVHLSPASRGPWPPGPRTLPLLTDPGLQVLAGTVPHKAQGGVDASQKPEVVR